MNAYELTDELNISEEIVMDTSKLCELSNDTILSIGYELVDMKVLKVSVIDGVEVFYI